MRYRQPGRCGLKISPSCLGAPRLKGAVAPDPYASMKLLPRISPPRSRRALRIAPSCLEPRLQ